MDGLDVVVSRLNGTGFPLEIWIDGSFVTEKYNPEDSDVAVRVPGEIFDAAPPSQQNDLLWFASTDLKPDYKCDLYVFPEYGTGHSLYDHGQWRRAYWLTKFGFSRAEEPKGLAVLETPYVVSP